MTLCVLAPHLLERLTEMPENPHATVTLTPYEPRGYLTTVLAEAGGQYVALYSETHQDPQVPADVVEAVAEFNADPGVWRRLVAEALDAQLDSFDEELRDLAARTNIVRATRRRLLGTARG